ncbi:hypothetical protein HispidOSU_026360 [Sigmodon hispidus]
MRGTCARTFLPGPRAPTLAKARRAGGAWPLGGPEGRSATRGASGAARKSREAASEVFQQGRNHSPPKMESVIWECG